MEHNPAPRPSGEGAPLPTQLDGRVAMLYRLPFGRKPGLPAMSLSEARGHRAIYSGRQVVQDGRASMGDAAGREVKVATSRRFSGAMRQSDDNRRRICDRRSPLLPPPVLALAGQAVGARRSRSLARSRPVVGHRVDAAARELRPGDYLCFQVSGPKPGVVATARVGSPATYPLSSEILSTLPPVPAYDAQLLALSLTAIKWLPSALQITPAVRKALDAYAGKPVDGHWWWI